MSERGDGSRRGPRGLRWLEGARNLAAQVRRGLPPVGQTPAEVDHTENQWRLLHYRARPGGPAWATPVLMVPSLINRHYILDLQPGRSLVEYLVAAGHDVWMIDWGRPGDEDRFQTWDDVAGRALGRAIRRAGRAAPGGAVHLLGYCLGGTLTAVHAAAFPERVASLALVAAPIDFHDQGLLSRWTRSPTFDVGALVDATGNVPWPLMQASFHMLRPTLNLLKAVTVLDRAWDDQFLDHFAALERWGNDNVSFPGDCYRRYVEELYRQNQLVTGAHMLCGRSADLARVTQPTLVVTFAHDHIVSRHSAVAALELIGARDKSELHLPGGHVGAVVSGKASRRLWPALSAFWAERDGADADTDAELSPDGAAPPRAPGRSRSAPRPDGWRGAAPAPPPECPRDSGP